MTEPTDEERAVELEQALAESQRLERAERAEDMDKQRAADERIVAALAKDENGNPASG